eukprot:893944-Lingulodinium_polyedra.AAC.1
MENSELLALLASTDRLKSTSDRALSILGSTSGAARSTNTTNIDVTEVDTALHTSGGPAVPVQAEAGCPNSETQHTTSIHGTSEKGAAAHGTDETAS